MVACFLPNNFSIKSHPVQLKAGPFEDCTAVCAKRASTSRACCRNSGLAQFATCFTVQQFDAGYVVYVIFVLGKHILTNSHLLDSLTFEGHMESYLEIVSKHQPHLPHFFFLSRLLQQISASSHQNWQVICVCVQGSFFCNFSLGS